MVPSKLLLLLLLLPSSLSFLPLPLPPSPLSPTSLLSSPSPPPPSSLPPKPTLNLLTKGPPQTLFVPVVKWFWKSVYKLMVGELAPHDKDGRFVRDYSADSTVSTGTVGDLDPSHQYHLYLGNPCPWCHRVTLALALLDLSGTVTSTRLADDAAKARRGGWTFSKSDPDPLANSPDLLGVYLNATNDEYSGRCTAPLLVDLTTKTLVSNESNDILRHLYALAGASATSKPLDLYPVKLRSLIDSKNDYFYNKLQNGVYRCGFSLSQTAYDEAAKDVKEGMEELERVLGEGKFVCGRKFTEADL